MLKIEEIRALALDEMEEKVTSLKKELLNLRIELKTGKLEKHARIRDVRKSVAKLLTIIQEEQSKEAKKTLGQSKKVTK